MNAYVAYGFFSYTYSFIRTNLLLVSGNLYNREKIYLSEETYEYIYERSGWIITLISIGIIHIFGKYILLNIIVALMKKDISETKVIFLKRARLEKQRAEELLRKSLRKSKKKRT
jgi:hypothetical protein